VQRHANAHALVGVAALHLGRLLFEMTPSTVAGALGKGTIATPRGNSRTSHDGRPYSSPAISNTTMSSECPDTTSLR
jgi:hypothetical protein